MAVTLNEYAKLANDPLKKGFILDLLRYSDVLNLIPFADAPGMKVGGTRWQTLPSVAFRKIGGSYSESTGTVENIQETLAVLGGDIHIDRILAKAGGTMQNPLQVQMQMKAKAVAFKFNDTFINGDLATDPDSFQGLKVRVSNMPSRMTIDLANAGDSLKVLAGSTQEHQVVDAIHQAIKYVDGANAIFCNEQTYLGLGQVARRLNLYQEITDALGRKWDTIGGVKFVDVGLKSDKSTEIITNTEDPGDGGNDATSMYVARIDASDGLHGLQIAGLGMDIYDPTKGGEDPTAPRFIRRVDWAVGLYNLSNYCIARVKGFKMAAS
jgi:hypothetical protein